MLTESRWQKEQELMRSVFPEFLPFTGKDGFGFDGWLRGGRSGTRYRVVLRAHQKTYPQVPPGVFMDPHIGACWIRTEDGKRLCMDRNWQPARSTFANTLLAVIRYLHEFDSNPEPGVPAVPPNSPDLLRSANTGLIDRGSLLGARWYFARDWRLP